LIGCQIYRVIALTHPRNGIFYPHLFRDEMNVPTWNEPNRAVQKHRRTREDQVLQPQPRLAAKKTERVSKSFPSWDFRLEQRVLPDT
jgi:hypothetical protein